jgi:hypothetical protein
MVDIPIEADVSAAARSFEEVGKAAEKGAKAAGKAVAQISDNYTKAAVSAERFRQTVMRAEKDAANRERSFSKESMRKALASQGSSIDQRVTSANLNLAARRNSPASFGETVGKGVDSVADALSSKFAALTTSAAAVAIAFRSVKFVLDTIDNANSSAGRLSAEMGARRVQLGQAGAAVGLSAKDIAAFQTAGGRMTVSGQETMLQGIGQAAASRPFGMPKLSSATAMKVLDYGQKTGIDLSSVLSNPAVQDGNVEQFLKMELTRRGADLATLNSGNRRGNATINSYNSKLPPDVAAEQSFQSDLSAIEDEPAKNRSADGLKRRAADAYLNSLDNGSAWESFNATLARTRRYLHLGDVDTEASNDAMRQNGGDSAVIDLLKQANKQRDQTLQNRAPKPTTGRNGDQ